MCVCAYATDYVMFYSFLLNSLNLFIDIRFIFFWCCCFFAVAAAAALHENIHLVEFYGTWFFRISPKQTGFHSNQCAIDVIFCLFALARARIRARYIDIDLANSLWMQNFLRKRFDWIRDCWVDIFISSGSINGIGRRSNSIILYKKYPLALLVVILLGGVQFFCGLF